MNYEMGGTILCKTVKEKDLGVTMNANMKVSEQCRIAASKGNQILGMIRRNITYKEKGLIVPLYKAIVRPHLEYCIQAWRPYLRKDIDILEKVQRRTTKLITGLRDLSYDDLLNPVTEDEIVRVVAQLKPKKSKGHGELDMCLIKKLVPYIVVPLKHIFNLSLLSGVFPDSMKIARVIPLFKTGNTKEFSNYRPISLLPQFSKILEKIYHSRLMAFIDSNQILYKSQYGFRKQMSTS